MIEQGIDTATAEGRVMFGMILVPGHLDKSSIGGRPRAPKTTAPTGRPPWPPCRRTPSHGAVVAREYGIPAVVGVPDATLRITTGQQITVHGATGVVELQ